jgi:hypothetical protein
MEGQQAAIDELCSLVWDMKTEEAKKFLLPQIDPRISDLNTPNSKFG